MCVYNAFSYCHYTAQIYLLFTEKLIFVLFCFCPMLLHKVVTKESKRKMKGGEKRKIRKKGGKQQSNNQLRAFDFSNLSVWPDRAIL